MSNIKYFEGKVCTVFTVAMNRNFKEENPENYPKPIFHYFMGIVESVDAIGIMLKQLNTNAKTYLFIKSVIAIAEEEVLDPAKPDDAKIIEQYKTASDELNQELGKFDVQSSGPYLDPDSISNLTKKIQEAQKRNPK